MRIGRIARLNGLLGAQTLARFHLFDDLMGIGIEDFRDCQEFYDVQTSIAVFILGDERLGLADPVGQGLLGHVGRLPRRYQALDQGLVLFGE